MELRKAEAIGVLNDKGVDIRNVDARFDDGGADQDLRLAVGKLLHHMAQALFVQLAVRDRNADLLAEELFELRGTAVDGLHTVVQVVDLPAARKLAPDGFGDHAPIGARVR